MKNLHTRLLALVLLLTIVLVGAAVVHAQSVTVRVGSALLREVAEVPITLEGSPGIGAMHLELTYDPGMLTVESAEPGDLVAGKALTAFNTDEPGRIVISLAAVDEITGDGTLAVARFLVSGETGQASTLDIEYPQAWDRNGFEVAVELIEGHATVSSSGLPLWLLAALTLLALLLIVLVVVLLARRGRRRKPVEPAYVEPPPRQAAAPPPTQRPPPPADQPPAQQPPARKFCGDCGQPLGPGKRFCIHCGAPVDG